MQTDVFAEIRVGHVFELAAVTGVALISVVHRDVDQCVHRPLGGDVERLRFGLF